MNNTQIDIITIDNVSIIKETETGIWRRTYVNSKQGRQELQQEVQEPYLNEILSFWGDIPTIEDLIIEIPTLQLMPSIEERITNIESYLVDQVEKQYMEVANNV